MKRCGNRLFALLMCLALLFCLLPGAYASYEPQEEQMIAEEPSDETAITPEPAEGAAAPEEEPPALDGISSVTITGSAPNAGDKAESFDPSVPYSSATTGCKVASRGRWNWRYGNLIINNPAYTFVRGTEYHFPMYIEAQSGYQFAAGTTVSFTDARLRGVVTNRTNNELTVEVYATMDGTFDPAVDTVKTVKLTDFTAPRDGAYPDRDVTMLFNNTNTTFLQWYDSNNAYVEETFKGGTYRLTIRVTTMQGFQFDRNVEVWLGNTKCTDVSTRYDDGFGDAGFDKEYGKYGYLEARFTFTVSPRTEIGSVVVRGLQAYAGDSAGAIQTSSLSCGASSYGFFDTSLQWKTASGSSFTGAFESGKTYVLDVRYCIFDADHYVFADKMTGYIDSMDFADYSVKILEQSESRVTVRYTVTAKARPTVIENVNILIDRPSAGSEPSYTAETSGGTALYETDPISWYPNGSSGYMTAGQRFVNGYTYKVVLWIAAEDGYSFKTGGTAPAVTVTVNGQQAAVGKAYEQSAEEVVEVTFDFGVCGTFLAGDADGNGVLNPFDAAIVLQYSAILPPAHSIDFDAADVSGDECIDQIDAALILKNMPKG